MTTKQKLLTLFENHPNTYLSGETIAKELCVSRNSVWKAVNELKKQGYDIKAVTNKGYCMTLGYGILSSEGINKYTANKYSNISIYKIVDSTNTVAKDAAENNADEWSVVIAEEQSSGKGRMNRQFYSPCGTGLYMSIILRPKFSAEKAVFITSAAAVAVAYAIEHISLQKAEIKWVNDVYCGGKKVCGILTQGSVNAETGMFDHAIVGIGINLFEPKGGFPKDIENIAGAVFEHNDSAVDVRNRIVADILDRFYEYYKNIEQKTFLADYKKRSFILGKKINVIKPQTTLAAEAVEIDNNCGLKVKYCDGTVETLFSGEVSTRLAEE